MWGFMQIDHFLLQRDWSPEVPYRPLGNAAERFGRFIVFTEERDFSSDSQMGRMGKAGSALRKLFSLPGATLRALASIDKSYYTIENSEPTFYIPKTPKEISVLTLNAACLPSWITVKYNNLRPTEERAKEIADYIFSQADLYDVICLQEVFDEEAFKVIHERLKEKYPSSVHHAGNNYVGFNSGLCIFSKYSIKHADFHKYSRLIGEDAFTNKGFLSADISVGTKSVRVYTTHTQAGGYPKWLKKKWLVGPVDRWRKKQLEPFKEHIMKAKNLNAESFDAVVITGDFNLNVQNPAEKESNGREFFALFRDCAPILPKGITGTTYSREYLKSHRTKKARVISGDPTNRRIIDGCFLTKNSKSAISEVKVIESFTNSSDHLAVTCKITFEAT